MMLGIHTSSNIIGVWMPRVVGVFKRVCPKRASLRHRARPTSARLPQSRRPGRSALRTTIVWSDLLAVVDHDVLAFEALRHPQSSPADPIKCGRFPSCFRHTQSWWYLCLPKPTFPPGPVHWHTPSAQHPSEVDCHSDRYSQASLELSSIYYSRTLVLQLERSCGCQRPSSFGCPTTRGPGRQSVRRPDG